MLISFATICFDIMTLTGEVNNTVITREHFGLKVEQEKWIHTHIQYTVMGYTFKTCLLFRHSPLSINPIASEDPIRLSHGNIFFYWTKYRLECKRCQMGH